MKGTDYNIALVVFFVSYISCGLSELPHLQARSNMRIEVPSNYLLAKFEKPAAYVGFLTVGFGLIMVFQGLVKNLGGLATTRFFLGIFEYLILRPVQHLSRLIDIQSRLLSWRCFHSQHLVPTEPHTTPCCYVLLRCCSRWRVLRPTCWRYR